MAADPKDAVGAALRWHCALWPKNPTGVSRAARARLRRSPTVLDVLMLADTHDLLRRLNEAGAQKLDERVAVLATALARVEPGESRTPFARALGQTAEGRRPGADERPRLSPARFGVLLRAAHARDWDGFARALRRALAILGDAPFDVATLVGDLLFLNEKTLQRWTYAYWQTTAPDDEADADPTLTQTEPVS